MESFLDFAAQLARRTGHLLMDYFHRGALSTQWKSDKSIVTEADLAADRFIADTLGRQYPDDLLLSEELQTTGPRDATDKSLWIVDPIDGTTNFSLGLHYWGVLLARLVNGRTREAVLYYPALDELFTVQQGSGAFLNGDPIHVNPPDRKRSSTFFSCCSRTFRQYQVSVPYKARILGCASYSFCALARGMATLSFEVTPKIWDIAGAWLLVQEAGGTMETYDGSKPFPVVSGKDYSRQIFTTLGAATPELAVKARQQIQPKI
jgi:myo-inositol-1(or 4)-monophosphatase